MKIITEAYKGYSLSSACRVTRDGRYSVRVKIERLIDGIKRMETFEDAGISLFLEIEAQKESINFGRNLIDRGMSGF